jgi:tetratricopeptide (TPR) repeat protein
VTVAVDPDVWSRATDAHRAGRLDEAEAGYADILRGDPAHAAALHQLGLLRHQKGLSAEAFGHIEAALKIVPDAAQVLSNAAVVLQSLKRYPEALAMLDRALAANPGFATAHGNRGLVLQAMGRHAEAVESFDRAAESQPAAVDLLRHRAHSLFALDRHAQAERAYRHLLGLQPASAPLHWCLGNTLLALKRFEDALASFDAALAIDPNHAEALLNRGNALSALHRDEEAVASYDRALAVRPAFPEALSNRGNSLLELARFDQAVASCDRAIALRPDYAQAHWNRSLMRLLQGELAEGFGEYEWRWKRAEIAAEAPSFEKPLWDGKVSLTGKTILLHAEQGLGDTIQFVRYVPLVAARGARIILQVQPALVPLLSTLSTVTQLLPQGADLPRFDCHCALLSLPLAFGTTLDTIPAEVPYLSAPPERITAWRECLSSSRPLVGLAWSGNPENKGDWKRSIPLAALMPLLRSPGIRFISLQYDVRDSDRAALAQCPSLAPFPNDVQDLADTAAVIDNLDLVISVDTSVAHVAGALGRPAWVLLPSVPDWRWLLGRDDSPWYPTARLFRRRAGETWDPVVGRVREAVAARFGSNGVVE